MKVWRELSEVESPESSVVTIGKFDGIHLGHQKLIQMLRAEKAARVASGESVSSILVTFDRHPDAVLQPERLRLPVIGINQKLAELEKLEIDAVLVLPFDTELASMSGYDFAKEILVGRLHAKAVAIGPDFRFGRGGAWGKAELTEIGSDLGFAVVAIEPVVVDGYSVSTSSIRDALDRGDVKLANRMLGRVHSTVGIVEHGLKIGRTIGFPTANISRDAEGYLPLDGVYAGWLIVDGVKYPAAHSVGVNETFQAVPRLVESHVIDREGLDLYEKTATLEYLDFIRPAAKFNSVEDLVEEINRDLAAIRKILSGFQS